VTTGLQRHLDQAALYAKGEITVGDHPYMDEAGLAAFEAALEACSAYLEFGSGGSSIWAARSGKPFVTVESDGQFLKLVAEKANRVAPDHRGTFLHADIGLVERWGYPVDTDKTAEHLALWRRYPERPWGVVAETVTPDLILIDGRFRVACALATIDRLDGGDWVMLVDDYVDRPHYRPIEAFGTLAATHGRMAEFRPRPFDRQRLREAYEGFIGDYE
jgi:hypothetical protein